MFEVTCIRSAGLLTEETVVHGKHHVLVLSDIHSDYH